MIDSTRGRSRGEVTSPMIVCGMRWSPAEPTPCPMRARASCVMSWAKPHSSDAMRNTTRLERKMKRAPMRSASLPSTGSTTVLASVYETMTQLICSTAPRSPAIVASEVATTV